MSVLITDGSRVEGGDTSESFIISPVFLFQVKNIERRSFLLLLTGKKYIERLVQRGHVIMNVFYKSKLLTLVRIYLITLIKMFMFSGISFFFTLPDGHQLKTRLAINGKMTCLCLP